MQPFPLGESEEDSLKRFQHVTEMTILTVQLIVEFSKRVPGFDTLLREDQITLLKVSPHPPHHPAHQHVSVRLSDWCQGEQRRLLLLLPPDSTGSHLTLLPYFFFSLPLGRLVAGTRS